jgi:hypothetical protein
MQVDGTRRASANAPWDAYGTDGGSQLPRPAQMPARRCARPAVQDHNRRAIARADNPSARCSLRISAQSSTRITLSPSWLQPSEVRIIKRSRSGSLLIRRPWPQIHPTATVAAIRRIERSLAERRFDCLLVQMATGARRQTKNTSADLGQSGCLPDRRSAVRTRLVPAG